MTTKPDEFATVRAALVGEHEPSAIEWYEHTTRLLAALDERDAEIARLRKIESAAINAVQNPHSTLFCVGELREVLFP